MIGFAALFLLIIMIPLVLGVVLWKRSKMIAFLCALPSILVILVPVGWYVFATNDYFVKTTDLEGETLSGIPLFEPFSDELVEQQLGTYRLGDHVDEETLFLEFNEAWITTDGKHEISELRVYKVGEQTSRGVAVGDDLDKAKELYGSNYANDFEPCMARWIFYVDRERNMRLEFVYDGDDRIQQIKLAAMK
ncbi:hypothetical protein [Alkalicoccobacillus gibsonii]|uniref:hypothetical protein n=1 Tax=Alkalicoccobacillus gibsonii TaxID=79881 RepID=UPI001931DBD3|nr:hypothetical protein [Alkalicoccobacillus gibsonii]MBM0066493.1 hypothetical protein [Alkalicoccobacillus gibsonii]